MARLENNHKQFAIYLTLYMYRRKHQYFNKWLNSFVTEIITLTDRINLKSTLKHSFYNTYFTQSTTSKNMWHLLNAIYANSGTFEVFKSRIQMNGECITAAVSWETTVNGRVANTGFIHHCYTKHSTNYIIKTPPLWCHVISNI